ncbi:hypothetical protein GQ42DRAFT_163875 [Ramicandelaber brevisporus]|nr:hypothetical protein GQ42DRAFT_163875 [Ramicandelaber brevisporus]
MNENSTAASNSTPPTPGSIGLTGIKINEIKPNAELYSKVRSAMAFAVKNRFRSLILYFDSNATNNFNTEPLPPSVPLLPDGTPEPVNPRPVPPISPSHVWQYYIPPELKSLYPIVEDYDGVQGMLFRYAFDAKKDQKLSVIILDDTVGRQLSDFARQHRSSAGDAIKVTVEVSPILDYESDIKNLNSSQAPAYVVATSLISVMFCLHTLFFI